MDLSAAIDAPPTAERRRGDSEAQALVGTRCQDCAAPCWPSRAVCHQCGSAHVTEEVFAGTGQLVTHTMSHVARPGVAVPYMLGQVQLDDEGPQVFGQVRGLDADAEVPCAVRTVVGSTDQTPWYWFQPSA